MTNLKLFGLQLDESGSNISALEHIFSDNTGTKFREAVGKAFCFANEVVRVAKKVEPTHKLELWDQAVKCQLEYILSGTVPYFVNNTEFKLEKPNSGKEVWKYGFHIFEAKDDVKKRFWNLPDGIIKTYDSIFALEFDHGNSIGKWATQLIKAIRSNASPKINGVLFCFCLGTKSAKSLFRGKEFTAEFQAVFGCGHNKPVGILTIDQFELMSYEKPSLREIADFMDEIYDGVPSGQNLAAKTRNL